MMAKYETFIFENYVFDEGKKTLELQYSLDQAVKFTETYSFNFDFEPDFNRDALERAAFGLFMMAGVSYYKTYLPDRIELNKGSLDESQKGFFAKTYRKGLGEFFYRNQLDPNQSVHFPVNNSASPKPIRMINLRGNLLPIGGGKDSVVAAEILSAEGEDFATWTVGQSDKLNVLLKRIGHDHLAVDRKIDPRLIELNAQGGFNGHIPITAIVSFGAICSSILTNRKNVIFAIERSSGEGNLTYRDAEINHQYSKTLEFERDLRQYVSRYISPDLEYFSLLRPLSELRIAEILARVGIEKYRGTFSSCNRSYRQNQEQILWCGRCPKCAFVFLILAPFVSKTNLTSLFNGENLFAVPELAETYDELVGLTGYKPFECVGEIKENRQAVVMARATGNYPELSRFAFTDSGFDYRQLGASVMPKTLKKKLEHFLDQV